MNSEVLRKILVAGAAVAALSVAASEKPKAEEREADEDGDIIVQTIRSPKRIDPG